MVAFFFFFSLFLHGWNVSSLILRGTLRYHPKVSREGGVGHPKSETHAHTRINFVHVSDQTKKKKEQQRTNQTFESISTHPTRKQNKKNTTKPDTHMASLSLPDRVPTFLPPGMGFTTTSFQLKLPEGKVFFSRLQLRWLQGGKK